LVVAPPNPITIGTHEVKVHIAGGAIAMVVETGHDVVVYNMHDNRAGSVTVSVGQRPIVIAPGQQLVLTRKETRVFEQANPQGSVTFRNARPVNTGSEVKAFIADYSSVSLMNTTPAIRQLLEANDAD